MTLQQEGQRLSAPSNLARGTGRSLVSAFDIMCPFTQETCAAQHNKINIINKRELIPLMWERLAPLSSSAVACGWGEAAFENHVKKRKFERKQQQKKRNKPQAQQGLLPPSASFLKN